MDQTIERHEAGPLRLAGYVVYEFDKYPKTSVLAGQTRKRYIEWFSTLEEARKAYPNAEYHFRDACNTFNHLPVGPDL